jgi:hypothetical protein
VITASDDRPDSSPVSFLREEGDEEVVDQSVASGRVAVAVVHGSREKRNYESRETRLFYEPGSQVRR